MILLTGATGNVGSRVAKLLTDKGIDYIGTTSKPEPSVHKMVQVDFNNPQTIDNAMKGINTVILITPAHKDMVTHQKNVIDSAIKHQVSRIIKLSGLGASPNAPIRLPKNHYEIEEYIKAQAIDYVFVRPNLFMQAVVYGSLDSINHNKKLYAPVANGKISVIDANDIAETIVNCVVDKDEINNIDIEITGSQAISFAEMASQISAKLQQPVQFVAVSFTDAKNSMLAIGMDEWLVDAFIELYQICEQDMGSAVLVESFKDINHRMPTTFDSFLQDVKELQ